MMRLLTVASLILFGCSDASVPKGSHSAPDGVRSVQDALPADLQIIQVDYSVIDSGPVVNRCDDLANTDESYCLCNPACCQTQTWYCPPFGTEIQAKMVVIDICGEDYVPCDRSLDPNCPPGEIIEETACTHMFDCPPGIDEEFTLVYDCEIDGVSGTQEVICDKGRLHYGECITCVPSDELCDYQDNDCDGTVDENKRNVCNTCGDIPDEICDGIDNDCDGNTDEELIRECETDCERGVEVCAAANWVGCTATRPAPEQCDGQDNDCDSLVDEAVDCQCPIEMVGNLIPCMEPPLSCGLGFKTCECLDDLCVETSMSDCLAPCHWIPELSEEECDSFVGIPTNPEFCNNFDEDCDQLVDESLLRPCYTGPENTVNVGVCTAGRQFCSEGQWFGFRGEDFLLDHCQDEVLPSQEVCDGADNDCDGTADFGEEIPDTDILFILDWSGSMDSYIEAVRTAMGRFSSHFSAEQVMKWGLIVGPKDGIAKELLVLHANISEFDAFLNEFAAVGAFGGTSLEMMKDALMLSIRNISANLLYDFPSAVWANNVDSVPRLQDFVVNWREDADRIVILFTDEEEQSYLVPRVDKRDLIDSLQATPNLKLFVFTEINFRHRWTDMALPTGGRVFELSRNQEQVYQDLMSIIDEICAPGDQQQARQNLYQSFSYASAGARYDHELGICH